MANEFSKEAFHKAVQRLIDRYGSPTATGKAINRDPRTILGWLTKVPINPVTIAGLKKLGFHGAALPPLPRNYYGLNIREHSVLVSREKAENVEIYKKAADEGLPLPYIRNEKERIGD